MYVYAYCKLNFIFCAQNIADCTNIFHDMSVLETPVTLISMNVDCVIGRYQVPTVGFCPLRAGSVFTVTVSVVVVSVSHSWTRPRGPERYHLSYRWEGFYARKEPV